MAVSGWRRSRVEFSPRRKFYDLIDADKSGSISKLEIIAAVQARVFGCVSEFDLPAFPEQCRSKHVRLEISSRNPDSVAIGYLRKGVFHSLI